MREIKLEKIIEEIINNFVEQKDLGLQFARTYWGPHSMEEKRPSSNQSTQAKNDPDILW